jgi:hypothetical protein
MKFNPNGKRDLELKPTSEVVIKVDSFKHVDSAHSMEGSDNTDSVRNSISEDRKHSKNFRRTELG